MSSLALLLLGPPRVERDGEPLAIDRRKALALLAYLAVSRQDHSRDALATLFWPEYDQSRARAGLRSALWSLTKALGEGWLDVDRESVRLKPDSDVWLDVDEFQDRLEECRAHGHPPDQPCPDCLSSLAEATALYRDSFMAGFTLPDSPGFDEWQFFQTEGLRQDLASALERLARGYSDQGEYEEAITHARRWVALDPLHEPAHCLLMQLYVWSGQRAAALRQFTECSRVLQEELGVPPDEETTQLFKAIKEKLEPPPSTERPTAPAVPREARPTVIVRPRHNLPVQLTPFIGREADLAKITDLLRDPACRLLALVGPGGSGKTRLALEASASLVPQDIKSNDVLSEAQLEGFQHGVFFVALAPLDAVDLIVPSIAQVLGFTFYGSVEPRQQLLNYLRNKCMLIILDNFEHLLEGADMVTDLLKTAPALKILVTSRTALNVQGEHLFPVPGMDFPDLEMPEDVLRYSAVRLFLQAARRAHAGFEPTDDILQDIVRICHLVEGMPLGILLATAWAGMLTTTEIVAEIGRSLDFLETDLRDVPQRQRSMRAVFEHSWNLLSARECAVMQALSVFRGGFTHQAAQQVTGASMRELRTLVEKSLLQRDPGGRYAIHELLRQYVAEKLGETSAEEDAVKNRHCAFYTEFLGKREKHLKSKDQKKAAAEIEAELENVRSGWRWAVDHVKLDEIEKSLESLAEFYWIRGWLSQGEQTFARAAQRLQKEKTRLDLELVEGATGAREAIAQRRSKAILGKVLLQQIRFCSVLGRTEEASELLQKSLAFSRDLGARREMAYTLRWLGFNASSPEEGKRLLEEGLAIFQEIGDQRGILNSLWGLGYKANIRGEYEDAQHLFKECLAISRELGNPQEVADSLQYLGRNSRCLGQYGVAKQQHQESLTLYTEIGDFWGTAYCLCELAGDATTFGEYEEAIQLLRESLAIFREIGDYERTVNVLGRLAEAAIDLEEYAEAIQLAQEGLALSKTLDTRRDESMLLRVLGDAACGLGDFQRARRYFQQASAMMMNDGLIAPALYTLIRIATLLAAEGNGERAFELLGLILCHPVSTQWTKDRAAAFAAELETELAPDIVAAAQEHGQARDLWATVAELLDELEAQL